MALPRGLFSPHSAIPIRNIMQNPISAMFTISAKMELFTRQCSFDLCVWGGGGGGGGRGGEEREWRGGGEPGGQG